VSDLTIIIPTWNRPRPFERLISYWSDQNDKYKFIIADSSDEATKKINKIKLTKYLPSAKILHSPSKENPELKFYRALKETITEFTIINPDDDFILKTALKKNLEQIKKNSNINLISCNHLNFKFNGDLSFSSFCTNDIYKKPEPCKRLYLWSYSKNAAPLIYSLHRKKNFYNIFNRAYETGLMQGSGLHKGNLLEHFLNAELILLGNFLISDDVLFCRSIDEMRWKVRVKQFNLFSRIKYNFNALFTKKLILKIMFTRLTKLKKTNTVISKDLYDEAYKKVLIRSLKNKILATPLVHYKNFELEELSKINESYKYFIKDKTFLQNHMKSFYEISR